MSNNKTGGPAFPTRSYNVERDVMVQEEGMTLRDYFAAKAMQSLATYEEYDPTRAAQTAYLYADAMLEERSK